MLVKGIVCAVFAVSAPFAIVATQDPKPAWPKPAAAVRDLTAANRPQAAEAAAAARQNAELDAARAELAAMRQDLQKLTRQLDEALDALEQQFQPQRERNCSPSRSRALLSHYEWLKTRGHEQRAVATRDKVLDQYGNDLNQLNSAAWNLMTEKNSAGKFDEVALAAVQRMTRHEANLNHQQLDTAALAHSLAGQFDRAVALQRLAIERGGDHDEYRRRLRTYEAAQTQVAKAGEAAAPANALLAGKE